MLPGDANKVLLTQNPTAPPDQRLTLSPWAPVDKFLFNLAPWQTSDDNVPLTYFQLNPLSHYRKYVPPSESYPHNRKRWQNFIFFTTLLHYDKIRMDPDIYPLLHLFNLSNLHVLECIERDRLNKAYRFIIDGAAYKIGYTAFKFYDEGRDDQAHKAFDPLQLIVSRNALQPKKTAEFVKTGISDEESKEFYVERLFASPEQRRRVLGLDQQDKSRLEHLHVSSDMLYTITNHLGSEDSGLRGPSVKDIVGAGLSDYAGRYSMGVERDGHIIRPIRERTHQSWATPEFRAHDGSGYFNVTKHPHLDTTVDDSYDPIGNRVLPGYYDPTMSSNLPGNRGFSVEDYNEMTQKELPVQYQPLIDRPDWSEDEEYV